MTTTAPETAPPAELLATLDAPALLAELAGLAPAPALEQLEGAIAATRARLVKVSKELSRPPRPGDLERLKEHAALREELGRLDGALAELEAERPALLAALEGERQRERQRRLAIAEARAVYEGLLAALSDPEPAEIPPWCYQMLTPERIRALMQALRKRLASDRERLRLLDADVPAKLTFKL